MGMGYGDGVEYDQVERNELWVRKSQSYERFSAQEGQCNVNEESGVEGEGESYSFVCAWGGRGGGAATKL